MASWIVHLRIAERLLERISPLDEMNFAVGNIAPDSGIPDEKWEKFTPPPEVSHFQNGASVHRDLADLEFYRHYLRPLQQTQLNPARYSFLLGYFFHLVTDNLWASKIGRPTKQKFLAQFEADKEFIWEVKRDWYGLDFEYVRSQPKSLFWRVFQPANFTGDYLDFMSLNAIQQRIDYIKGFYLRTDEEVEKWYIQHPGLYLTQVEMDAFVAESADLIERAYVYLMNHEMDINGHKMILEKAQDFRV